MSATALRDIAYLKRKLLREGSTSSVYTIEPRERGASPSYVLKRGSLSKHGDEFAQEYDILRGVDHPNIVRVVATSVSPINDHFDLYLTYHGALDLVDYMLKQKDPVTLPQAILMSAQIVSAVSYIHALGICHLDIKCDNICVEESVITTVDGACVPLLTLVDFGHATHESRFDPTRTYGTNVYASPELFAQRVGNGNGLVRACDVWSLGIVMFAIQAGSFPWTTASPAVAEYADYVACGRLPDPVSSVLEPLLTSMLAVDAARRPTITEVETSLVALWPQALAVQRAVERINVRKSRIERTKTV